MGWSPSGVATSVEAGPLTSGEGACSTTCDRPAARSASTAATGPHAAGVVDVVVANPDGHTGVLSGAFTPKSCYRLVHRHCHQRMVSNRSSIDHNTTDCPCFRNTCTSTRTYLRPVCAGAVRRSPQTQYGALSYPAKQARLVLAMSSETPLDAESRPLLEKDLLRLVRVSAGEAAIQPIARREKRPFTIRPGLTIDRCRDTRGAGARACV